jgi:NitT/TauT family transport system substrate-binding protein
VAGLALAITGLNASAETIRIAIGTQDTTINCATGGCDPRAGPARQIPAP